MIYDYLIVGAGLAGSVLAERIAKVLNKRVLVIDKREHFAGNCYDYIDEFGVLIHKYGPHAFHTNSNKVWEYLGQFTEWNQYEHRVLAEIDGQNVPVPFNLTSLKLLFPVEYAEKMENMLLEKFGYGKKIPILKLRAMGDPSLTELADYIYDKVFLGYTIKQWDLQPEELDESVTSRVPVFISADDRYFQDEHQAIPLNGYTNMIKNILDNELIEVRLNTEFKDLSADIKYDKLIFTGALDEFYNYRFGELDYRSLRFDFVNYQKEFFQEIGQLNFPNDFDYTRITEFKYMTHQKTDSTTVAYEYPEKFENSKNERYYPIPREESQVVYRKYAELAAQEKNIYFIGRLPEYKYYNMDAIVIAALNLFESKLAKKNNRA
ncbi:MAG: UDP-galactopyranose mutase [bacterium]